ncbi:hypothetical protein AB3X91_25625 [Paraburkholderia sp. BR14263]|uniref:hypothetical protein n=1 Tax=unclassified Paraburkholderia TaxID=2615204 RepID=UPI0034CEC061
MTPLTLIMGPIDDRPPLSNRRTMQILDTSVWLTISPAGGDNPAPALLRPGALITAAQLGRIIPGLAKVQWKPLSAGFGTKIANEYAAEVDGLRMNLVFGLRDLSIEQDVVDRHLERAARMLSAALQAAPGDDVAESWDVTIDDKRYTVCVRGDRSWWAAEEPDDPADPATAKVVHAETPPADVEAAVRVWAKQLGHGSDIVIRRAGDAI